MGRAMLIRPAIPTDAFSLYAVERESIEALWRDSYTDEQIRAWCAILSPEYHLARMQRRRVLVAAEGEALVGFAQLNLQRARLIALYVRPDRVHRGVGSALLTRVEREIQQAGAEDLILSASLNAVGFYARSGYAASTYTSFDLADGVRLLALNMHKVFKHKEREETYGKRWPHPSPNKR